MYLYVLVYKTLLMKLITGSLKEFMEYAKKHPEKVKNIMNGIMEGRLNFCPVASSEEEAASIEKKLRQLFAENRNKNHFKIYLDPAITSKSRGINSQDIQPSLDALTDNWARAPVSDVGTSGRADATRVSISILCEFTVLDAMLNRPVCMRYPGLSMMQMKGRDSLKPLRARFRHFATLIGLSLYSCKR
jgi:hypothetical protein